MRDYIDFDKAENWSVSLRISPEGGETKNYHKLKFEVAQRKLKRSPAAAMVKQFTVKLANLQKKLDFNQALLAQAQKKEPLVKAKLNMLGEQVISRALLLSSTY